MAEFVRPLPAKQVPANLKSEVECPHFSSLTFGKTSKIRQRQPIGMISQVFEVDRLHFTLSWICCLGWRFDCSNCTAFVWSIELQLEAERICVQWSTAARNCRRQSMIGSAFTRFFHDAIVRKLPIHTGMHSSALRAPMNS